MLPVARGCKIIKEYKNGLVGIEKAAGVMVHPNFSKNEKVQKNKTLLNTRYDHDQECYIVSPKTKLYLTHRLDSPTSGLLLASFDKSIAEEIKRKFKCREIQKTYFAIVGLLTETTTGKWKDLLEETRARGKLRVRVGRGSVAITECFLEAAVNREHRLAMLRLIPKTGRTHQLRVQTAIRKMPIVGDKSYGNFRLNRVIAKETGVARLCLHSTTLKFKLGNDIICMKSELPHDFLRLVP